MERDHAADPEAHASITIDAINRRKPVVVKLNELSGSPTSNAAMPNPLPPYPFPMQVSSGGETWIDNDMQYSLDFDEKMRVKLLVWLSGAKAARAMGGREFWMPMRMGALVLVRFRFAFTWLNRAAFEAAEVRPEDDPEPRQPGALWLPIGPLSTHRATTCEGLPSSPEAGLPHQCAGQ